MSNVQIHYHFKLDFQKVDQHTGGKWLIHGSKHQTYCLWSDFGNADGKCIFTSNNI